MRFSVSMTSELMPLKKKGKKKRKKQKKRKIDGCTEQEAQKKSSKYSEIMIAIFPMILK